MKIACSNCGADIKFIPSTQKCRCEHCGTEVDINEIDLSEFEVVEGIEENEIYNECTCSSCDAKLIVDNSTTVTNCVYCGGNQIIKERFQGVFRPDIIIPFKIDKETFVNDYKNFLKKKILAPKEFKNNPIIEEIKGMYVPFYVYDFHTSTYARGSAVQVTKKQVYHKFFESEYELRSFLSQDASVNFDDNVMATLKPFNFEEVVDFNPAYLNGFLAENRNEAIKLVDEKAKNKVIQEVSTTLDNQISPYFFNGGKIHTKVKLQGRKYALLPVWFFNSSYKGKQYPYAVNGQTGKIAGQIPLSKPKFFSLLIFMFLIIVLSGMLDIEINEDGLISLGIFLACLFIVGKISKDYTNVEFANSVPIDKVEKNEKIFNKYTEEEYCEKFGKDDYSKIDIKAIDEDE